MDEFFFVIQKDRGKVIIYKQFWSGLALGNIFFEEGKLLLNNHFVKQYLQ